MKLDLISHPKNKFTLPQYRYYKFITKCRGPITDDKISKYWKNNVASYLQKPYYDYEKSKFMIRYLTEKEIKQNSLLWFDRWTGKFIRLNIINSPIKIK